MKIKFGDKVAVKGDFRIHVIIKVVQNKLYYTIPDNVEIEHTVLGEVLQHCVFEKEDIVALAVEKKGEKKSE